MTETDTPSSRAGARSRLVEVAADLLAREGPDAVTTRSVAIAAGVQAPMIYRLFGDKNGLLEAVVHHGFSSYVAQKAPVQADVDPIAGLRTGWDLHVGFGVANPALFRLMHTGVRSPDGQAVVEAGVAVLYERVRRVAQAGQLRVPEKHAVDLIHAAGTGVVFTLIEQPEVDRDDSLSNLAWASVCAVILVDPGEVKEAGPTAAAVTLRASLPDLSPFTPTERALFGDWLDRITDSQSG